MGEQKGQTPANDGWTEGEEAERDRLSREIARLQQELAQARAQIAELERLADSDALTPVPNRRAFERELHRAATMVARYHSRVAVMFVDVNGLKQINDTLGHGTGDAALVHVATVLRRNLRAADIVARIGGDEFGMLLYNVDADSAAMKADLLQRLINCQPLPEPFSPVLVSAAIGSVALQGDDTMASVLARADAAMYHAKRGGDRDPQRSDK